MFKTKTKMIKSLADTLKDVCLRHKAVGTFRYQTELSNNAQHNYATYQCYLDSISYHQLNVTTNIFKSEVQLYILAQPTEDGKTVEDIQDEAFTIAVNIIGYIDTKSEFQGVMSVYDYSILTLSDYTAQRSAGVKLSLVLQMPNPLNLCTIDDNFGEYTEDEETPLEITTIKLPITPKC